MGIQRERLLHFELFGIINKISKKKKSTKYI